MEKGLRDSAATDLDLVRRAARGDEAAFHEIVNRHGKDLYGLAYSLVGSAADAEDVLQETLVGAYRSLPRFEARASVKTWLTRILVRQAARWRRSGKVAGRKALSLNQSEETGGWEGGGKGLETRSPVASVDAKVDVAAMLETLSADHREILVLRHLKGLSYEEIANVLGVPRGTVESRLFRARRELEEKWKGFMS